MSQEGSWRDPHDDKRRDLARQRVNVYGEGPKGSRSAIRRRKAFDGADRRPVHRIGDLVGEGH